jgi:bacterial/archaeal transporter family-2 protein
MKTPLLLLAIFFGVVLTVHLAMNGKVGAAIDNPRVGNMVFWCIGAVGAIIIGLTGWQSDALTGVRQVNPLLLTAGLMGASLVFGIAWLFPKVGAADATIALLGGQILSSMVLSHYGWLGSPVQPVTMRSVLGAIVMLAGILLATRR